MLGALIGGGLGLLGSIIGGNKAKDAAKSTKPKPYGVSGPAGSMGVDGNQLTLEQANSPFGALLQSLVLNNLSGANSASGQYLYGADPQVAQAYQGLYGQGLTDRIQGQYDLLNKLAAPGERRADLALEDNLYSKGMTGTSGGAERFRALEEAQAMADLQRQQAAVGLGRQEALDRFTGALQGTSQGMGEAGQQFGMAQGGFSNLQQLMQNLFQQAGLGIAAGGGQAPHAAVYASQQAMAPWQAGASFLQQAIPGMMNGGYNPVYQGGGVPMVSQPTSPINIAGVPMPIPSVPGL